LVEVVPAATRKVPRARDSSAVVLYVVVQGTPEIPEYSGKYVFSCKFLEKKDLKCAKLSAIKKNENG
tara:strand:- start:205 stop:405 length:201 start_codon:yes stop_codon:yes gene_type:complete